MNKVNVYVCSDGHKTITSHHDAGVTPMFLMCREKGCGKRAVSQMYKCDQNQDADWEWYKPTDKDIKKEMRELLDSNQISKVQYDNAYLSYKDHVKDGGLLLRKKEKA